MIYTGWSAGDTIPSAGVAVTTDAAFPLGWVKSSANPILAPTANSPYDSGAAMKPAALRVGGRLYFYYSGFTTATSCINLAATRSSDVVGRSTWVNGKWQFDPDVSASGSSSLIVGSEIFPGTGPGKRKLTVGSTTGDCELTIGQAPDRNLLIDWKYYADGSSAYANIETYGGSNRLAIQDNTGLLKLGGSGGSIGFYGTWPVSKATALTTVVAAAPAGGTGVAAGGWDTSAHRDAAIATINNTATRLTNLETRLRAYGLLP